MGSLTVSLTPSLNPKMTLTKFLRHVTRRVSVYFFILSSVLFLYFIFTFLFIFYLPNQCTQIAHARLPHVHRTCGCAVNSPHNRTCGARAVNVRCGFFLVFFVLRIDVSKIQVSDKKNTCFFWVLMKNVSYLSALQIKCKKKM